MTRSKTFLRFLPPLLWMVIIFLFSSRPDLPKNEVVLLDFILKKAAHFFEYFILVFLWHRALSQKTPASAFLIALFYAFTDETHQLFVPGRTGLLRDVAIDAAGATLAVFAITKLSNGKNISFQLTRRHQSHS